MGRCLHAANSSLGSRTRRTPGQPWLTAGHSCTEPYKRRKITGLVTFLPQEPYPLLVRPSASGRGGNPWKRNWVGSALCCCSLHRAPSSRGTVPLGRGRRGILRQRDHWSGQRPCLLCTLHTDMWIRHDRTGVWRVHQLMPQIWERVRRGKGHLNSGHSIG